MAIGTAISIGSKIAGSGGGIGGAAGKIGGSLGKIGGTIGDVGGAIGDAVGDIGGALGFGDSPSDPVGGMPQGYSEPQGQRAAYVWDNGARDKENAILRVRSDGSPGSYPGQVLKKAGPDHGVWEDLDNVRIEPGFRVILRDRTSSEGTGAGARTVLENRGQSPKTVNLKTGGYAVSNNGAGYIRVERIGGAGRGGGRGGGLALGGDTRGNGSGRAPGDPQGGMAAGGGGSVAMFVLVGVLAYLLTQ